MQFRHFLESKVESICECQLLNTNQEELCFGEKRHFLESKVQSMDKCEHLHSNQE